MPSRRLEKLVLNDWGGGIKSKRQSGSEKGITLSDALNVECFDYTSGVGLRTMQGNRNILLDTSLFTENEEIVKLHCYKRSGVDYLLVHTIDDTEGRFYQFDFEAGALTLIKDGLSNSSRYSNGVNFINGYIFTNGVDDPFIYDSGADEQVQQLNAQRNYVGGLDVSFNTQFETETPTVEQLSDYWSDSTERPLDDNSEITNTDTQETWKYSTEDTLWNNEGFKGKYIRGLAIEIYNNRVFIADDYSLYYSAVGNPRDWNTEEETGYISNFSNSSSPITSLKKFSYGLIIFRKDDTSVLSGQTSDEYVITTILNEGSPSFSSFSEIENKLFFFATNGIYYLKPSKQLYGQIESSDDISEDISDFLTNLNFSENNNDFWAKDIKFGGRSEIWFNLPKLSSNSEIWIFNLQKKAWFRRVQPKINSIVEINNNLYSCRGQKILQELVGYTFDGEYLRNYFVSSALNLGADFQKKRIKKAFIGFANYIRNNTICRYIYDQDESEFEDEELDIGSDDILYWDFETRTWDNNLWAITQYLFDELPKVGRFNDLQISLRSKKLGDKFILQRIEFKRLKIKT
jgi:hypothetical protein